MAQARTSLRRILWVYGLVCVAVFGATRLEPLPVVGQYVHLVVAAIFLLTSIGLTRSEPAHYGVALGGLLEPSTDDEPAGPLGLFDLSRAVRRALPFMAVELGVAAAIAAVVFPLYAVGFYWWNQPAGNFSLTLPPNVASFALAQLIVVALPRRPSFAVTCRPRWVISKRNDCACSAWSLRRAGGCSKRSCSRRCTSWSSPTRLALLSFSPPFYSDGPARGVGGSAPRSGSTR